MYVTIYLITFFLDVDQVDMQTFQVTFVLQVNNVLYSYVGLMNET